MQLRSRTRSPALTLPNAFPPRLPAPALRCSEGMRVGWSDELLGFDCGGQQWVLETAFPAGTLAKPDSR